MSGRCASCFYGEQCREDGGCEYYTPMDNLDGVVDTRGGYEEFKAAWRIYASQYDEEHTD